MRRLRAEQREATTMNNRYIAAPTGEHFPLDVAPPRVKHIPLARQAWNERRTASIRTAEADGSLVDYLVVDEAGAVPSTLKAPLTVFSALNPDGRLLTNEMNFARTHHLYNELERLGFTPRFVTLFDRSSHWVHRWYEPAVAITGDTATERAVIVRAFGQIGCIRVGRVTIRYEAPGRPQWSGDVACAATPVVERSCPMDKRRVDEEGRCVNPGGPWVGESRRCAVLWSWARTWTLGLYGCDLCSLNKKPTPVRTNGTAPTAAVEVRRRSLDGNYEIVVADGEYGHTSGGTVGVMRTGATIHAETGLQAEPQS
jgi:hypothetical protein